jgi:HPt (histidine-containing phosphotransfer) domain-containing protein
VVSHEVPVVAVTADPSSGEGQACRDAGANACVPRPIEPDALRAAIEGLLPAAPLAPSALQNVLAGPPDLLDRQALLARLGGDEELCREVLAAFLESTPELIGALRQAAAEGDAAGLQRHGKTLKDASANVSAVALSSVAYRIVVAAQEGVLEEATALVERLEQEFQRLDSYLVRSASKGT